MRRFFYLIIFILISLSLFSDDVEELYSDMYDFFVDNGLGATDYSGLNSFLTLYVPPGGKYEGMGTAFTGVSDDIGFFNANPSVSSRLDLSEVSFFHNNFIEDVNMETVAFTGRYNDIGYGFQGKWLHIGFTSVNDWAESVDSGIYSEFVLKNNISLNVLRGFDFSGISIGTSLNMAYRSVPSVYDSIDVDDQSALAAFFDLGILTEFNFMKFYSSRSRNLSLGLSLLNVGREFIENPDPLPTSANFGFAYSPISPLTISYDLSYKFNIEYDGSAYSLSEGEGFYHAVGFDMQFIDLASVHGGFLYKPGTPRISLGTEISYRKAPGEEVIIEQDLLDAQNEYIFVINYSLDLVTESPLNRFSIELKINLGDYQRFENREKIQELYVKGLQLYSDGEIEEAMDIWEICLSLDSKFDPAIRMMELAEKSLALQQKIRDKEVIE